MKTNKLKIIIVLIAAIMVSIFNFIQEYSIKEFSYTLLIVMIIFYIIGAIVQKVVNYLINKDNPPDKSKLEDPIPQKMVKKETLKTKDVEGKELDK